MSEPISTPSGLILYTFGHFMLSSIQQGIQSGHVAPMLFRKYRGVARHETMLYDWAAAPTVKAMNGGNSSSLREGFTALAGLLSWNNTLVKDQHRLPYAGFWEDKESAEGTMTCYGVLVPDGIASLDPADDDSLDDIRSESRWRYSLAGFLQLRRYAS